MNSFNLRFDVSSYRVGIFTNEFPRRDDSVMLEWQTHHIGEKIEPIPLTDEVRGRAEQRRLNPSGAQRDQSLRCAAGADDRNVLIGIQSDLSRRKSARDKRCTAQN